MLLWQGVSPRIFNADGHLVGRAGTVFAFLNSLGWLLFLYRDYREIRSKMHGLIISTYSIDLQDWLLIFRNIVWSCIFVILLRVVVLDVDDCL